MHVGERKVAFQGGAQPQARAVRVTGKLGYFTAIR